MITVPAPLRRLPWWFWALIILALYAGVSHAYYARRIAVLQQNVDLGKEEMAKAASAVVEATLVNLAGREKALEARLRDLNAVARRLDERLVEQDRKIAATKTDFDRLAAAPASPATTDEIVDRARQLGIRAVPAPRPR